jgi:hypothetical protein
MKYNMFIVAFVNFNLNKAREKRYRNYTTKINVSLGNEGKERQLEFLYKL